MKKRYFHLTQRGKIRICLGIVVLVLYFVCRNIYKDMADIPTLYDYYTEGGIVSGLETLPDTFLLNKKNITLFSGAIHYFRVHPDYWRDRLRKLRAAGFNVVETYVPWNLHEPEQDVYDFGDGGNDMSMFLNVMNYIKIAQEEDLLVLIRPSPYICSEWDFGGMPSWLLRYPGLVVRTSEPQFLERVRKYNNKLLPLFKELQFTRGGPIIGFQIENEYGGLIEDGSPIDMKYLLFLKDEFEKHNIVELLYTSDNPSIHGERGAIPEVLQTANFQVNPADELALLKKFQPDKPLMVMEFWAGWFDHWFETHHTIPVARFSDTLDSILKFPSSVNLYMFHGGTNFGFFNGANVKADFPRYQADVTSYDYDAPLSEAGDYTDKYRVCKELVDKYNKVITKLPPPPPESKKVAFPSIPITEQMDYAQILDNIGPEDRDQMDDVISMEHLEINNGNGQSYGYVVYRHAAGVKITESSKLQIKDGVVHDMAIVLLDGERQTEILTNENQLKGFGYWETPDAVLNIESETKATKTLDIFVENWGRVNFGLHSDFEQCKGLRKGTKILFNNKPVKGWETFSLEFKSKWIRRLINWQPFSRTPMKAPKLMRAILNVGSPADTFIDMTGWGKGAVFINGFNLGRYFSGGPPQTLYLPAPLLKTGENEIVVFELFAAGSEIRFKALPILG